MMRYKGLKLDSNDNILNKRGLGSNRRTQKKLDKLVIEESSKYIPKDSGDLINSSSSTTLGSGEIKYDADYASSVYYTKKNYNNSPQRGAYWFERMKTDKIDKLLRETAEEAGGDGEK